MTPDKIGGWPAFAAYVASNYSSSTVLTIVQFATEEYDLGGHYDNSTYKFTAPYDGIYNFSAAVHISNVGDQAAVISLFRNTTQIRRGNQIQSNSSSHNQSHVVSADIQMLAGDTAEIRVQTASAARTINSGAFLSYFTGHLVTRTS